MNNEKEVKIKQNEALNVRLSGGRSIFIALAALWAALGLSVIEQRIDESNTIKKESNEIKRQELEQAKKQYQLDSLKYFAPFHTR